MRNPYGGTPTEKCQGEKRSEAIIIKKNLRYGRYLDLLGLKETRLHRNILDCDVSVVGYEIYRFDWDTVGGGVAMCVKNTQPHPRSEDKVDPNLEIVGI